MQKERNRFDALKDEVSSPPAGRLSTSSSTIIPPATTTTFLRTQKTNVMQRVYTTDFLHTLQQRFTKITDELIHLMKETPELVVPFHCQQFVMANNTNGYDKKDNTNNHEDKQDNDPHNTDELGQTALAIVRESTSSMTEMTTTTRTTNITPSKITTKNKSTSISIPRRVSNASLSSRNSDVSNGRFPVPQRLKTKSNSPVKKIPVLCKFFAQGKCRHKDNECRFLHTCQTAPSLSTTNKNRCFYINSNNPKINTKKRNMTASYTAATSSSQRRGRASNSQSHSMVQTGTDSLTLHTRSRSYPVSVSSSKPPQHVHESKTKKRRKAPPGFSSSVISAKKKSSEDMNILQKEAQLSVNSILDSQEWSISRSPESSTHMKHIHSFETLSDYDQKVNVNTNLNTSTLAAFVLEAPNTPKTTTENFFKEKKSDNNNNNNHAEMVNNEDNNNNNNNSQNQSYFSPHSTENAQFLSDVAAPFTNNMHGVFPGSHEYYGYYYSQQALQYQHSYNYPHHDMLNQQPSTTIENQMRSAQKQNMSTTSNFHQFLQANDHNYRQSVHQTTTTTNHESSTNQEKNIEITEEDDGWTLCTSTNPKKLTPNENYQRSLNDPLTYKTSPVEELDPLTKTMNSLNLEQHY